MYITIETSQRTFVTDPEGWQGQSLYFENLLSQRWAGKKKDEPYFIESDGNVFEHILRYLRTGILPVFYDRSTGHNFSLYQAVLEEAKYFTIGRLEKWLCTRKYLDAVKVQCIATETQDRGSYGEHTINDPEGRAFMVVDRFVEVMAGSNMETTVVPMTKQINCFYCPDAKHGKSNGEYCRSCFGRARESGVSGYGGWKMEEQIVWCIVRKEVIFDHDLCVTAFREDN